jgi:hypothetical protein
MILNMILEPGFLFEAQFRCNFIKKFCLLEVIFLILTLVFNLDSLYFSVYDFVSLLQFLVQYLENWFFIISCGWFVLGINLCVFDFTCKYKSW